MKTLTSAAVKKLKPGTVRREIRDGGAAGLYLVVQPSGAKSWALRLRRPSGKTAKLTLGTVDLSGREIEGDPVIGQPLSLVAARRLAADVARLRAIGKDVVAEYAAAKRRRRFEIKDRANSSFAAAARDYIEGYAQKKRRRWEEQGRVLGLNPTAEGLDVIRGGLAERWVDKPVAEVSAEDIDVLVDEARLRGIPGLAKRRRGANESRAAKMFSTLSRMFGWVIKHRKVYRVLKNPCSGLSKPDTPPARDRVLTDAEIVLFWLAAETIGEPFSQLLKLLLLTGCRLREVAGMTRSELSDGGAMWALPGERTKNRRPHIVPLPRAARGLLASVRVIAGKPGYVLTTTGRSPVSGFSKIKRRLDAAMIAAVRKETDDAAIPPWRLHDLRRTAATGMAEIGIAPHIVEACLNHVSGTRAGVAGVYNRAVYAAEKKAALERWASHVEGLVAGREIKIARLR
jgi:integrase